ncbi:MAG: hypothetical protein HYW51_02060 [Candidatus Doudnabacteria bacterium]|nr:hypothetical protein [Candidatus Doudnabacteria bacterium]
MTYGEMLDAFRVAAERAAPLILVVTEIGTYRYLDPSGWKEAYDHMVTISLTLKEEFDLTWDELVQLDEDVILPESVAAKVRELARTH